MCRQEARKTLQVINAAHASRRIGSMLKLTKILLNIIFGVMAVLVVARAVTAIKTQEVFMKSSKERVEKHANDDSSTSENLAEPTLSSSTATTRDELVATLNCSYIRDFATAAPAIGGFTCASDGRKSHPMTIFQYVNSGGIAAKNARIKSAVQKACDHNREEVFVLSSPEIFVYTLSSIAVDSSPLADSFMAIKTGLCS